MEIGFVKSTCKGEGTNMSSGCNFKRLAVGRIVALAECEWQMDGFFMELDDDNLT